MIYNRSSTKLYHFPVEGFDDAIAILLIFWVNYYRLINVLVPPVITKAVKVLKEKAKSEGK